MPCTAAKEVVPQSRCCPQSRLRPSSFSWALINALQFVHQGHWRADLESCEDAVGQLWQFLFVTAGLQHGSVTLLLALSELLHPGHPSHLSRVKHAWSQLKIYNATWSRRIEGGSAPRQSSKLTSNLDRIELSSFKLTSLLSPMNSKPFSCKQSTCFSDGCTSSGGGNRILHHVEVAMASRKLRPNLHFL